MHAYQLAHSRTLRWVAAIVGALALSLATGAAAARAEESNPNNYECKGHIEAGKLEPGSEEQPVAYTFYCDGPITGYQLESNVEVTGAESAPLVTNYQKQPLASTFSCSSEIPGWAVNCVGSAPGLYERVNGQFSIETPVCTEPRVDPVLTVTYAYLEKEAITQAISGPFELGRPLGCKADAESGHKRLAAETVPAATKATTTGKTKSGKAKTGNKAKANTGKKTTSKKAAARKTAKS